MIDTECVLNQLRKPQNYERSKEEWRAEVKEALVYGCDWIETLLDRGLSKPLAVAVSEMAWRLDDDELRRGDY